MATINKQIEKWMSRASFDALDKSTIPEGTEINIVGDIQESDLSLELQNKVNCGLHLYRVQFGSGLLFTNLYVPEELTLDNMSKYFCVGDGETMFPIYGWDDNAKNVIGGYIAFNALNVTSMQDTTASTWGYYSKENGEVVNFAGKNYNLTFTKIF